MSDLQCAATLLVACPAGPDGESVERLADALADRRVAIVYSSPQDPAALAAAEVANRLGVACRTEPGLAEPPDDDSAPSDVQAVARYRDVLGEVADLHRGETVLLVSHRGVMSLVLPRLAFDVPDGLGREHPLPDGGLVELLVDGDGCSLRRWPGAALGR